MADKIILETVSAFNNNVRFLLKVLIAKRPTDTSSIALRGRLNDAIRIEEGIVIRESGPYFLEYKDKIKSRDDSFLNDITLHKSIESKATDKDSGKKIVEIISAINEVWTICSGPERERIFDVLEALLNDYIKYLLAVK